MALDSGRVGMLNMLAEKVVQPPISPRHMSYCPSMDLIACASIDGQVTVYRLNGQKVLTVNSKTVTAEVNGIEWKPNGQIIAVAFENCELYLASAHTGKVVHQINYAAHSKSAISCLGWGMNIIDAEKSHLPKDWRSHDIDIDDLCNPGPKKGHRDDAPDLPRNLAFLDVEALLPRLSSLSSGGIEDDVFTSRTSLETLFQPVGKGADDSADLLVIGFEDGSVHLSIYDFFDIGHFSFPEWLLPSPRARLVSHCYHPLSTTHPLLVASPTEGAADVSMIPLDLRLISNTGGYLSLLASKSTRLHNILRYMQQVQKQMYSEFQASQDLPRRFIRNIEDTLQETQGCAWTQAAYHTIMTGHCFPQVKEWLVDEIGERGYKRWEKATSTGYESIRRLAHENLLPALERFTVVVSRLRGLSKFQDSNASFGLSTQELDNVLDTVGCLQLLTHHVLIIASSELNQFIAFSAWLHQEIEIQSTERSVSTTPEASERDSHIDHVSALEYIHGAMKESRLVELFNVADHTDGKPQWDLAAEERSLYELYKRELRLTNPSGTHLPGLDSLLAYLDKQCNSIFQGIAESQKRNVRFGPSVYLGLGNVDCVDTRLLIQDTTDRCSLTLYVLMGSDDKAESVMIFRIELRIENGMSSATGLACARIDFPLGHIRDAKFVDDHKLMLIVKGPSSSKMLSFDYRKNEKTPTSLNFQNCPIARGPQSEVLAKIKSSPALTFDPFDDGLNGDHLQHTFPAGANWTPERICINGRKGRRAVCVLAQDHLHYRIFDLDSSPADEGVFPTNVTPEDATMT